MARGNADASSCAKLAGGCVLVGIVLCAAGVAATRSLKSWSLLNSPWAVQVTVQAGGAAGGSRSQARLAQGQPKQKGIGPWYNASANETIPLGGFRTAATPGVILWAHGRSGTTLFMQTMKQKVFPTLRFCNDKKESFRDTSIAFTAQALKRCMRKQQLLMHIKPSHLGREKGVLQTPESFFRAAAQAGYTVIIAVHRDNELAHELSQVDLVCRKDNTEMADRISCAHTRCERRFCHPAHTEDFLSQWEREYKFWHRGVKSAVANGLHVLNFTFGQLTKDACGAVKQVTQVLSQAARKKYTSPECAPTGSAYLHTASLHDQSAIGRMGEAAHRCFEKQVQKAPDPSKYTWMLDLTQEVPPQK